MESTGRRARRAFTDQSKAEVVALCRTSGVRSESRSPQSTRTVGGATGHRAARDHRVHRGVLPSPAPALHARLLLPGRVRSTEVLTHKERLGSLSNLSVKPG